MGLFKKLGGLVSNPIRGIGRIARGHIREGLRDIAGTAKVVAPFIPGIRMSDTTTSKGAGAIRSSALAPLSMNSISHSSRIGRSMRCKPCRIRASSSTNRILFFMRLSSPRRRI